MKKQFQLSMLCTFAAVSLLTVSCGGGEEKKTETGKKDTVAVADTTAQEPKTYRGYTITEKDFPATVYVTKREVVKMENMSEFFGKHFEAISKAAEKAGHTVSGAPCGIYFTWDDSTQTSDMAAAFPVVPKGDIKLKGYERWDLPASKCLLIEYMGAYEKSGEAHGAMDDYIKEKGLTQNVVIEEYITDPMTEPDTTKWLTNIYYILK